MSTVHLSRFDMFLYFRRDNLIISEDVHCKIFSNHVFTKDAFKAGNECISYGGIRWNFPRFLQSN